MNIMTLNYSDVVKGIIPISNIKGNRLNLITVQNKFYKIDILTKMFKNLPEEVYFHSIRVANIADILAKVVNDLPEGMDVSVYSYSIWLGCLYHHIGEGVHENIGKEQTPNMNMMVLDDNRDKIFEKQYINPSIVFDIVQNCCERHDKSGYPNQLQGDSISLPAPLAGFADVMDGIFKNKSVSVENKINEWEHFVQEKGEILFGSDVIEYYEAARENIYHHLAYRKK